MASIEEYQKKFLICKVFLCNPCKIEYLQIVVILCLIFFGYTILDNFSNNNCQRQETKQELKGLIGYEIISVIEFLQLKPQFDDQLFVVMRVLYKLGT